MVFRLLILLLITTGLSAQVFQKQNTPFQFRGLKADTMLVIPAGLDTPVLSNPKWSASMDGALFLRTADSTLWVKVGQQWVRSSTSVGIRNFLDSTGNATNAVIFAINGKLHGSSRFTYDSALVQVRIGSPAAIPSNVQLGVSGQVELRSELRLPNIGTQSDTITWKPVVSGAPGTANLQRLNRWPIVNNPLKLNLSDTASMLAPYAKTANIPAPLPTVVSYGKNAGLDSTILLLSNGTRFAARDSVGASGWGLLGNAGTNPTVNFIGSTDNVDFVIRRNNLQIARFYSDRLSFGLDAGNQQSSNFFGTQAGFDATSAGASNFFGAFAGNGATGASHSNFFGQQAGNEATGASFSNFFGDAAGNGATNASNSNFFGRLTGFGATGATHSNFFGQQAGNEATGASFSTLFGFRTGLSFTGNNIGSNNIIIGTNISLPDATANSINLGGVLFGLHTYSDITSDDPSIVPTATGKIGIRTVTPLNTLHITSESAGTSGLRFQNLTSASSTLAGEAIGVNSDGDVVRIAGGGGGGTVTSFGKIDGLGITSSVTNPTTTPVHTVAVDTSNASILSRQRAANTFAPISVNGTVTSFGKVDGLGIVSSITNPTTTPVYTVRVDTADASVLSRQRAANTYALTGASWGTLGNAGTNPANDFLGTTDNQRLVFRTNNVEQMTVLANGNVGIGRSPTAERLEVLGSISVVRPATGNKAVFDYSGNLTIGCRNNDALSLITNNLTRLQIASDGNMDLGSAANPLRFRFWTTNETPTIGSAVVQGLAIFNSANWLISQGLTPANRGYIQMRNGASQVSALLLNPVGGGVGIGTLTPAATAVLDVTSTTQGFLPPRMTIAQRNAIASPANGLIVFCTDATATDGSTGVSQTFSSSSWRNHY